MFSKLDKMDSATLLAVAAEWSFWGAPPPKSVPRRVALPSELRDDAVLVVQGVRRCGKSTLMTQMIERYALDPQSCLFVNFEDPRLLGSLDHHLLQAFVDAFEAERGPGCTFFFDEIQSVDGWQKWARMQVDRPRGRRFVVSGSNAHLLGGELASTLTGRNHVVELHPFDFDEYRTLQRRATVEDYLFWGGFPATIGSADAERTLRGYFHDIVERDVRERVGARSSLPLRQLAQILFESAGSELSQRRVAASLGMSVGTVAPYLEAIESAYLAFSCPYFAYSERKRLARNKKYYPVDTGLRRVSVTPTGADRGKQLECATFVLLRRRFRDVCYWRDGGEVDFVVTRGREVVPIQVTWDGPQDRHHQSLDRFYAEFPTASEAVFVTAESYSRGIPELDTAAP